MDSQLIADGTHFAVEPTKEDAEHSAQPSDGSVGAGLRPAPFDLAAASAAEYFQPVAAPSPLVTHHSSVITYVVACGGWSQRKTLYGGDHYARREDSLLDPARGAAKVRAFFVHPPWARRGIGEISEEQFSTFGFGARKSVTGNGSVNQDLKHPYPPLCRPL